MDWYLINAYFATLHGAPYFREPPRAAPPGTASASPPSDLDLQLIRLAYQVVCPATRCVRCHAQLGRGLQLAVSDVHTSSTWRVLVSTRCRGWRRHRHTAVATEHSDSLLFGILRPAQ